MRVALATASKAEVKTAVPGSLAEWVSPAFRSPWYLRSGPPTYASSRRMPRCTAARERPASGAIQRRMGRSTRQSANSDRASHGAGVGAKAPTLWIKIVDRAHVRRLTGRDYFRIEQCMGGASRELIVEGAERPATIGIQSNARGRSSAPQEGEIKTKDSRRRCAIAAHMRTSPAISGRAPFARRRPPERPELAGQLIKEEHRTAGEHAEQREPHCHCQIHASPARKRAHANPRGAPRAAERRDKRREPALSASRHGEHKSRFPHQGFFLSRTQGTIGASAPTPRAALGYPTTWFFLNSMTS
jgi:hypothetical protein